ncbi:hypothetical protein [Paenibacillus bovis]|uniref:Aminodeoxychorismate lyase n=1 Tax=Paenibacillus bovis TaxID=1616788 RepID=A0A172ZG86_9BACL|nr:hypothetical protein [Paenibacillus bovis]ANF96549.1 hypothetical protein AR543_11380 [Paenibacillus bovis]
MIKNRSFIIGIGIGMIVGAILLQIMNIGKGQTMMNGSQLTPEQIQEAAQAQNMQVFAANQKVYTSEQWKQLEAEEAAKKAEAQKGSKSSSTKEPTAPTSPEQPKASTNESTTQPKQPSSTSTTKTQQSKTPASPQSPNVSFTINPGENLDDVAFSLKKEGLIGSQSEFINKATERKANTKLQVGTFEIGNKQDYDDIISIITGQPSS